MRSKVKIGPAFGFLVVAAAAALAGGADVAAPGATGRAAPTVIRLGGSPLELLAARGALWVLTCDRRCSGEGRHGAGRVVRIAPRRGRVIASATIERPGAIAVGGNGVFATDFWRDSVRRIDPVTLRETARLKLVLPPQIRPRGAMFLPNDVAVGPNALWVSTEWCAVERVDQAVSRALALVRLPCDAYQTMAFGAGALWVSESLAGLYRVDPDANDVVARIRIGPKTGPLVVVRLLFARGRILAVGSWTQGGSLTRRNGLAFIDPGHNRVSAVTPLPSGALLATLGQDALWVAPIGGSTIKRIDPSTGITTARLNAKVSISLAFADRALWTAFRDGTIRRIETP